MSPRLRFVALAIAAAGVAAVPVVMTRSTPPDSRTREGVGTFRADWGRRQVTLHETLTSARFRDAYRRRRLAPGDPFARLIIAKLGVDMIVVEGVSGDLLRAGAGHYPDSAYPGDRGNVAIAGQRTQFGQPFRHLERLVPGDLLVLITPSGRYAYKLIPGFDGHPNPFVVGPLDWRVIGPAETAIVTLTTTDPPHSSKNQLIARFSLVSADETPPR